MRFLTVAIMTVSCWAVSASAIDFKEGNWRIEVKTEIAGMPMQMPPVTVEQCLNKSGMVPAQKSQDGSECKVTDKSVQGNTVRWTVKCPESTGKGQITYNGTTLDGKIELEMQGRSGGMKMTNVMHGAHIGTCSK